MSDINLVERWERFTDDEGFSGVRLDDSHSVGWDLEGWGQCCEQYMRLIESAPDLLRACQALIETRPNALYLAKRAVKKATDETDYFASVMATRIQDEGKP